MARLKTGTDLGTLSLLLAQREHRLDCIDDIEVPNLNLYK